MTATLHSLRQSTATTDAIETSLPERPAGTNDENDAARNAESMEVKLIFSSALLTLAETRLSQTQCFIFLWLLPVA